MSNGQIDPNNSTTTPLKASAQFVGNTNIIYQYASVSVSCVADQPGLLVLEQTPNMGVDWISVKSAQIKPLQPVEIFNAVVCSSYRVRFQNFTNDQQHLTIQALLHSTRTTRAKMCGATDNGDQELELTTDAELKVSDAGLIKAVQLLAVNSDIKKIEYIKCSIKYGLKKSAALDPIRNLAGQLVIFTTEFELPSGLYNRKQLCYYFNQIKYPIIFTAGELRNLSSADQHAIALIRDSPNSAIGYPATWSTVAESRHAGISAINIPVFAKMKISEEYDIFLFEKSDILYVEWPEELKKLFTQPCGQSALADCRLCGIRGIPN